MKRKKLSVYKTTKFIKDDCVLLVIQVPGLIAVSGASRSIAVWPGLSVCGDKTAGLITSSWRPGIIF
jgi:hypothetical protein